MAPRPNMVLGEFGPIGPARRLRRGCKRMNLKFEIQPTAKPTPDRDRDAKLAHPSFRRVFTHPTAINPYDQANGLLGARLAARAHFSLDTATGELHYARGILEGPNGYPKRA